MTKRVYYKYYKRKPITGQALKDLRKVNRELNKISEQLAHLEKRASQGWRTYEGENIFKLIREFTADMVRAQKERDKIIKEQTA